MKVKFDFSGDVSLVYRLNSSCITADWLKKLCKLTPSSLNKTGLNHRHGFANDQEVLEKFEELKLIAEKLGFKLLKYDHQSLNQLHVEFPKFHLRQVSLDILKDANRLNLLIHWLEYNLTDSKLFNLDFNDASEWPAQRIIKTEMQHFSTDFTFGDLHLHYVHVGRPLFEMYLNNDQVTPQNQFKAQHFFNATCGMVFREAKADKAELEQYYNSRGGKEFFQYAYNDPLLANGYFKLGQLEGYNTIEEREVLRGKLLNSTVIAWEALPD